MSEPVEPGEPRVFRVPLVWKRTSRYSERLRPHVHEDGCLESFGDGGYPLYYIVDTSNRFHGKSQEACCPKCATDAHEQGENVRVTRADVNWEDPSMFCACGERIPSAYAECDKCDNSNVSTPGQYYEACDDEACDGEHLGACLACRGVGAVPNCEECNGKAGTPMATTSYKCRACKGTGK